jgi:membrane protein DedA with SNARE-associated domain
VIVIIAYFIPGIRHITALSAGSTGLKYPVFAVFAYTGGFIWAMSFFLVGFFFGKDWSKMSEKVEHHIIIVSVLAAAILLLYFIVKKTLWKGK